MDYMGYIWRFGILYQRFCNAGFDIFGGTNIFKYNTDPLFCLVIAFFDYIRRYWLWCNGRTLPKNIIGRCFLCMLKLLY